MCQWYQITLPVSGQVYQMQFINSNTGWATVMQSNSNYYFIKTTNSGVNWTVIYNDSSKVQNFQFFNDTLGYARGQVSDIRLLSRTTNGGNNWTVLQSSNSYVYTDFYFINPDTGWVAAFYLNSPPGVYIIFKTNNALQSLENIYSASYSIFGGYPSKMKFFNEQYSGQYNGLYLANGKLWKTTNSGYNWQQISTGFTGNINSFSFINKDTGWAVQGAYTTNSRILKTMNGGNNWITQYEYPIDNFEPDYIYAINNYIIFCGILNFNYKILKSSNGGSNWGSQTSQIWNNAFIYMYDSTFGFTWTGNQIARTTNGGGPITKIEKIDETIPLTCLLKQNYPNPFNSSSTIEFDIPKSSIISLILYDLLGREVLKIIDSKELKPGIYKTNMDFNNFNISSGIYFYKLNILDKINGKFVQLAKKMIYLK
jgi:hypothetical protein